MSDLRRKALVEHNGLPFKYSRDRTILHLIEDQARRTPDRPAVVWESSVLTYRQLSDRSSAWAAQLRASGVTRGELVPVVSDGGPGFIIAIIAVMRCAGAFVPMDWAWPPRRLQSNIAMLAPRIVITTGLIDGQRASQFPSLHVDTRTPTESDRVFPGELPAVDDLIYGYFTSGSTGEPKCSLNRHLGLLNRFLYMTRHFGDDGGIVLQNSSHVFDSSIWQLLWPLTMGGATVLPRRAGILDLPRTIDVIERHSVTMTDFVPSVFNTLVYLLAEDPSLVPRLGSLRCLLIGGEAISPSAVRIFRSMLPDIRVVNTYGPTEASIGCVFHEVSDLDDEEVPIGRPIDNTYVALLDDDHELVMPGKIGEICLGGDCLGAGYLHAPDRITDSFIDNPFDEIPGSRLFPTGDLAYHRHDGQLIFVGRRDHQIKLGGVRIEPGEIEAAVVSHPAVQDAKVIVQGDGHARRLVCCVLGDRGLTADVVRDHASSLLAGYAVPQSVVFVDRMPLMANGKVDRGALAHVVSMRSSGSHTPQDSLGDAVPPLGSCERAVQRIWQDLLCCDAIGISTDFYECGGTSLTLQRLATALHRRFNVRVPLRDLAAAATIREQVDLLDRSAGHRGPAPSPLMIDDVTRARAVVNCWDSRPLAEPAVVLLTGATGFVGLQLLTELLNRTNATIWCLVRANGAGRTPPRRVADALRAIGQTTGTDRVITVAADLAVPQLGLGVAQYSALADSVDTVVHSGALVNLVLGYSGLRRANVLGTTEVLRLVAKGRPKRLHAMSTMAAPPQRATSHGELASEVVPLHGYQQSKWVAEKILTEARERGLPSTIYRLGEVMPHAGTGWANPRSALDQLLRACARTGLRFPTSAMTDWTPVDTVSRMVITAMTSGHLANETVGLVRPGAVRIDSLFDLLEEHLTLREVSYAGFWSAVKHDADGGDPDLVRVLGILSDPGEPMDDGLGATFFDRSSHASPPSVLELAERAGVTWFPPQDQTLRTYVRRMAASALGTS